MTASNHLSKGHLALIFGVPTLLILSAIYFTTLPIAASQDFSYAITLDLIITVPIIYFLLIRKTEIPKLTVVTFLLAGVFIASYFVPNEHHGIIDFAKHIMIPLIEFTIIGSILFRVRQFIVEFRKTKNESPDFMTTLRIVAKDILPKRAVEPFVLEIAMIYYCFFTWKKPITPNNGFTYHKKSDLALIFGVFIGLVLMETFVFHILMERWSSTVAWIGTAISFYSMIQIIGIVKSAARRPILLEDKKLILRFGLMHETEINLEDIEKIELSQRTVRNNPLALKMGTDLTSHNVIIFLKKENVLHGLFGIKKSYDVLSINVDEKIIFKEKVEANILKYNLQNEV